MKRRCGERLYVVINMGSCCHLMCLNWRVVVRRPIRYWHEGKNLIRNSSLRLLISEANRFDLNTFKLRGQRLNRIRTLLLE